MHPVSKKRGRPFKADLSAVRVRSRAARPSKDASQETLTKVAPLGEYRSIIVPSSQSQQKDHESRVRNRVAATKSRAKAQAAIHKLQGEERELRQRNEQLLLHKQKLRDELLFLQNEILRQTVCDCPLIRSYLVGRANQLANGNP